MNVRDPEVTPEAPDAAVEIKGPAATLIIIIRGEDRDDVHFKVRVLR